MINPRLKIVIKDVLEKEAVRRVNAVKGKPNNSIFVNTNEINALRSLPEDAFKALYPQVSQYDVSESELKEFLKWACHELNIKYAGMMPNPFRPMRY